MEGIKHYYETIMEPKEVYEHVIKNQKILFDIFTKAKKEVLSACIKDIYFSIIRQPSSKDIEDVSKRIEFIQNTEKRKIYINDNIPRLEQLKEFIDGYSDDYEIPKDRKNLIKELNESYFRLFMSQFHYHKSYIDEEPKDESDRTRLTWRPESDKLKALLEGLSLCENRILLSSIDDAFNHFYIFGEDKKNSYNAPIEVNKNYTAKILLDVLIEKKLLFKPGHIGETIEKHFGIKNVHKYKDDTSNRPIYEQNIKAIIQDII